MEPSHDTLRDLAAGTPAGFVLAARSLPLGILGQFLLAGLALSGAGTGWAGHAVLGTVLLLPVGFLLAASLLLARLRGFAWWAGLVALLYAVQVALGAGGGAALALHPLNGALLLSAGLVLLAKVERRSAASRSVRAERDGPTS